MQHSKLFISYIDTCFKKFNEGLADYFSSGEVKPLFKMRVSIKKLRASLKCIEHYYGEKKFKKSRKQFKEIFMKGGYLRELRKYEDWCRKHSLIRVATWIRLDDAIKKQEEEFEKIRDKITKWADEIKKLMVDHARKLSQEDVYQFYLLLVEERMSLFFKETKKNNFHAFRKEIKRILYARHWQDERGLQIVSKRQAVFLDQYQHLIGNWHDHEEMGERLRKQKAIHVGNRTTANQKAAFEKAFQLIDNTIHQLYEKVLAKQRSCAEIMRPVVKRIENARKKSA